MTIRLGLISVLIMFSSSALSVTTCEQYVSACVNNKNNRMEKQQCICVWNAAVERFNNNHDQLAFLIAAAAKDPVKTQALLVKLGQEVAPVMEFAIMQPGQCAGVTTEEQASSPPQDSSATVDETSSTPAASAEGAAAEQ